MTEIHWLNPVSGSFTNPADWSGGNIPGPADDALLDAVGDNPYTITSSVSESVNSIQTNSDATLSITGGIFTATQGTGSGENAGVILVGAGAAFAAAGIVANSGKIALYGAGGGQTSTLAVGHYTTLTGGGELLLSGHDRIAAIAKSGSGALFNYDDTIIGSGKITRSIVLVNEKDGVVDANKSSPIFVFAEPDNSGLMEATGGGTLVFQDTSAYNSPTGVILAADQSVVQLNHVRLTGGLLESAGSGEIVMGSSYLDGTSVGDPVVISANVKEKEGDLSFAGSITNNGTISLANHGRGSLFIASPAVILGGKGVIDLNGGLVGSDGATLVLGSGTIRGSGNIGVNNHYSLTLTVGEAGVIDADTKGALIIATNATTVTNAGTIETTGPGGLSILDIVSNTGLLAADDGALTIGSAAAGEKLVNDGVVSVKSGGIVAVYGAVSGHGHVEIAGGTLDFLARFDQSVKFTSDSGVLELAQSTAFTGTVKGFSRDGATGFDLADVGFVGAGEATFSGTTASGVLTVTDGVHTARINMIGDYLSSVFVTASDGHGGVTVATQGPQTPASTHAFVAAMASFAKVAGGAVQGFDGWRDGSTLLARPHTVAR